MENSIVHNLSDKILKRIKDGREIRDEQILLFLECALDAIEKKEFQDLPSSYYLLKEKIYKYKIYDKMDELDVNQAFSYGNIWSSIRLIEIVEKRKKEEISIEVLAKKYIKNIEVFQIMKNSPGIKHKDLAEKCRKTASELSQLFNQISEERFFSFIRLGREKYYYLEEKGDCLLIQMKKQCEHNVDSKLAATRNKFIIKSTISTRIPKSRINIDGSLSDENSLHYDNSLNYNNDFQNEYVHELQDKLFNILDDDRGQTIYKNIHNNYTRIEHYYIMDGKKSQVFVGDFKKVEISNNKIGLKPIDEQYISDTMSV